MYYAKFTNNQLIYKGLYNNTYYNWYISVASDNIIVIRRDNSEYLIVRNGIIKDNDIYLPLEDSYGNLYCPFSCSTTNYLGTSGLFPIPSYSSEELEYNLYTYVVEIYDEEFNLVDTYPYMLVSGSNTGNIIVIRNPTQMYSQGNIKTDVSGYLTNPTATYKSDYYVGQTIEFKLTDILKQQSYGTLINYGILIYVNRHYYVSKVSYSSSKYTYFSLKSVVVNYSKNLLYANGITYVNERSSLGTYTNIPMTFAPLGKFDKVDTIELEASYSYYGKIYCKITNDMPETFDLMKQNDNTFLVKGKGKNTYIDFDKQYLCLSLQFGEGGGYSEDSGAYTGAYSFTGRYYLESKNGNLTCLYQNPYTPTTKLKTPTFSDLEILHNEDTGTYALTFKANNPNSVSVSVDITISGREGTDNITLPSGDSEWSFALSENKAGTLQGTNISALGYENADDTPKYNYYEWVAPGYLRELVINNVYLMTSDDKTYNLNIVVYNNNSVSIPCIIHYGKSGTLTKSKDLSIGYNYIVIDNTENINGIVWIHPEKVDGYYQLPDTDAVSYTKLPIPPTPSSTGITLYKNNNNNKVVNKGYKLETYKVLNGTFRDSVNILNPVFQIENDEVPECNYCYIADFRRYYYIDTITCIRTGLYEIECSVDVLYTYKDSILNSEQYISRQENEYNELLKDDMVTFDSSYDYNIYYQNIDELDYGIATGEVMKDYDRTNILVSWFGIKS